MPPQDDPLEQMADLCEVLGAIAGLHGVTLESVVAGAAVERGGFAARPCSAARFGGQIGLSRP